MTIDDLFKKIGILTIENDMLREQLNAARAEVERLTQRQPDPKQAATEESPQE